MASHKVSFVVARSENHVIGCENKLPWHIPSDLKRFKKITSGRPIIMGRYTYESIGHPLPNRTNIVISRDTNFRPKGVHVFSSKEDAMTFARTEPGSEEIMVIGGETMFELFKDDVSKVYLTIVHADVSGDTRFNADFTGGDWTVLIEEPVREPNDQYRTTYREYERRESRSAVKAPEEFAYAAAS